MERCHMLLATEHYRSLPGERMHRNQELFLFQIPPGFSTDEAYHLANWQGRNVPVSQTEPQRVDLELRGIK